MDNATYWQTYEKATGLKRPAWIDGIGNVNYSFGKKDPPPPKPLKAAQTAQMMPQVQSQALPIDMMPQANTIQPWRPGLRGWRQGW